MRKELVKAAVIIAESSDLMTTALEFYGEVARRLAAERRRNTKENDARIKKLMKNPRMFSFPNTTV